MSGLADEINYSALSDEIEIDELDDRIAGRVADQLACKIAKALQG